MARPGGTAIPEKRSLAAPPAFVVGGAAVTYLVHQISSGDECGWSWSAVGGACRAIILVSIVSGLVAGAFAAASVRAGSRGNRARMAVWGVLVVVTLVLGTLAAKQFQDYRTAVGA